MSSLRLFLFEKTQSDTGSHCRHLNEKNHGISSYKHVLAHEEERYICVVSCCTMNIVWNGCTFKEIGSIMREYLGERFDVDVTEFEAPMPSFMHVVRPHIKGVAIKK